MNERWHDREIADWLAEGPNQGPVQGLERALAAAHRAGQRPAWTFPGWWLPWSGSAGSYARLALLGLLLVLAMLALAALASTIGAPTSHTLSLLHESADTLLAYGDETGIVVARADGSQKRALGLPVDARSPMFSPDGKTIAYLVPSDPSGLGGRLFAVSLDGSTQPRDLSGGREVPATRVPSVDWSPRGSRIAFAARDQGVARIFVVGSDGGGLTAITDTSADADLPSWSTDGSRIAYRVTAPDGVRTYLRTALSDGTDLQEFALVVAADGSLSRLRWSPANESVSYAFNPGFGSPTSALIDFHFQHTIAPWADGIGGYVDYGIPWSPDGKHLAILTAKDGVIVADSVENTNSYDGQLRQLGHVADCWVDWSPDGSALYGGSPDGCQSVVVIPLSDPSAAFDVPGSIAGVASWQPLP